MPCDTYTFMEIYLWCQSSNNISDKELLMNWNLAESEILMSNDCKVSVVSTISISR